MKKICLYFQIHQPFRFKRYRFFNIGIDDYYYDDYANEFILRKVADRCYLPVNKIIEEIIKEYGCQFKIAFSLSGAAIDQFRLYAPDVLESFQRLAKSDCVEFLGETYSHSLASLAADKEFENQVNDQTVLIEQLFGKKPKVFRNTELIYSDEIGKRVSDMGFEGMITEGAKHILGWKSPNFLYCNAINPRLKLLLRNYTLSDDIAFRFSNHNWAEYPLTAEKFAKWLSEVKNEEEIINLFMDYETFGEHQGAETGIFDFLRNLPGEIHKLNRFEFVTPSQAIAQLQPISAINVTHPISWADEEKDLTAWLGNELQQEAFKKLYDLSSRIKIAGNSKINKDWRNLQISDHFYYMSTKIMSDGEVHAYFNPFESPYDAFINYMNILSDFEIRLKASVAETDHEQELLNLLHVVADQESKITKLEADLRRLRKPSSDAKASKKSDPKNPLDSKKQSKKKPVKTGK